MHPTSNARSTRRRSAPVAIALAVAALCGMAITSCDVPVKPAGGLFDSWKGNDADGAHAFATDAAVDQIFAKTWMASSDWLFVKCDGAAGSTYCTWVNRVETSLRMQVNNASSKVVQVQFIPIDSGVSGRFIHAWRKGNSDAAQQDGTPGATFALFSIAYHASDHWLPTGCSGAVGSIYCTWASDAGETITTQYDNVETHKVIAVKHEFA